MAYIPSHSVRALIEKLIADPHFKESFLKDPKKAANDGTLLVTERELLLLSNASTDELDVAFRSIPEMINMAHAVSINFTKIEHPRIDEKKFKELKIISSMIAKGESAPTINANWETVFKRAIKDLGITNAEEAKTLGEDLINSILTNTYEANNADLLHSIQRTKFLNDMQSQIQNEISRTRKIAEEYIDQLLKKLETNGEDAQLANVDLQNALQKQQLTLQMVSTISKLLYDTAMAIVRKMNGT